MAGCPCGGGRAAAGGGIARRRRGASGRVQRTSQASAHLASESSLSGSGARRLRGILAFGVRAGRRARKPATPVTVCGQASQPLRVLQRHATHSPRPSLPQRLGGRPPRPVGGGGVPEAGAQQPGVCTGLQEHLAVQLHAAAARQRVVKAALARARARARAHADPQLRATCPLLRLLHLCCTRHTPPLHWPAGGAARGAAACAQGTWRALRCGSSCLRPWGRSLSAAASRCQRARP